ncbi:MAG: hypothetical protein DHS20C14_21740 [Phycisphaeraceae bacterium]|nr:MAG: hypothetical protein DHS20C14_21740 [Phycisphaeraceae bacterium]
MKIREQTPTRLVLSGIPGGWRWMLFAAVLGLVLTAAVVAAGVYEINRQSYWSLIWIALGLLIAQGIFWVGAVTLAVGRERLELDLTSGRGRYGVKSPIVETGSKPFSFDLALVHSISLERFGERRPGGPDSMERNAKVARARLRTAKPRRAVKLDETENGRDARVCAIAEAVAEFLGLEVVETGG